MLLFLACSSITESASFSPPAPRQVVPGLFESICRSPQIQQTPYILKEDGSKFFGDGYKFEPGKDEILVEGKAGYIVTFGDLVYRAYDAVLRLRQEGIEVGLINKPTLNVVDEEVLAKAGKTGFVLVAESQNQRTGVRPVSVLEYFRSR
jgi:transketolase C-terminal domain/subunit